jgi:hypothetical protein
MQPNDETFNIKATCRAVAGVINASRQLTGPTASFLSCQTLFIEKY